MRFPQSATVAAASRYTQSRLNRFGKDQDGATAVEFGLIAVPFVVMLVGVISVCLYFFTVLEIENAVWNATRDLRTGLYSTGGTGKMQTYEAPPTDSSGMATWEARRKDKFKEAICKQFRDVGGCMNNVRIMMKVINTGAAMTDKPSCKNGSNLVSNSTYSDTPPEQFMVVTACYAWEFGASLPFFKLGNVNGGDAFLMQATNAFVIEPYK